MPTTTCDYCDQPATRHNGEFGFQACDEHCALRLRERAAARFERERATQARLLAEGHAFGVPAGMTTQSRFD